MNRLTAIIASILLSSSAFASGWPVVDTNEVAKQIQDSLYLVSSLDELSNEIFGSNVNVFAVDTLIKELHQLQRDIDYYERLNYSLDEVTNASLTRSKVFTDQVRSITQYIRKVKRVMGLISVLKPRPEAVTATANMLKEQRQREKEKFELALKALEEREKVEKLRMRLRRKIKFREELDNEMQIIGGTYKNEAIPQGIVRGNQKKGLW